jgi:hypothetical protein
VLFVKPIVLTFAIASVTLSAQLFPILHYLGLGNSVSFSQTFSADFVQVVVPMHNNQWSVISDFFSISHPEKKSPINKVEKYMKIEFRQSGGYGGLRMGCDIDINSLKIAESNQLESLIKNSDILRSNSSLSKNSADLITYEIKIETKEGIYQVKFDDLTLPESIIPLLDYLQNQAKPLK